MIIKMKLFRNFKVDDLKRQINYSCMVVGALLMLMQSAAIADCNQSVYTKSIEKKAILLLDQMQFARVIRLFEGYDWETEDTPYSLMLFCTAVNESGKELTDYFEGEKYPIHISKFAEAYSDLLHGKASLAKSKFIDLKNSSNSQEASYGYIGLFESDIFTLNFKHIGILLTEVKNKRNDCWIMDYNIIYNFNDFNFEIAVNLIRSFSKKKLSESLALKLIQIQLKMRDNKLQEALELLDESINYLGNLQDLLVEKNRIISILNGQNESYLFLAKALKKYPYMWKLDLEKQFLLLEQSNDKNKEAILEKIKKIASSKKNDIPSLLGICNALSHYGYHLGALKYMQLFMNKTDAQYEFFLSNLFMAKNHLLSRNKIRFQVAYRDAMNQSQNDIGLQWFTYDIAVGEKRYSDANLILKKLLDHDPNNINTLSALIHINVLLKRWDEVTTYYNIINKSNRFIDDSQSVWLKKQHKRIIEK